LKRKNFMIILVMMIGMLFISCGVKAESIVSNNLVNQSAQIIYDGVCGLNLTWVLTDDGVLTISGTGDMYNWRFSDIVPTWTDYKQQIKSVVIEKGVTSIGNYAFVNCYFLKDITIADSVISIGNDAFGGCVWLESIIIPDSVTSIGENAFKNCALLESITIADSVTFIGTGAFSNSYLENITLSNNLTSISDFMFFMTHLNSITIPDGVTHIGTGAFMWTPQLKEVIIPDSVTYIGNGAFSASYILETIIIPNSVTYIGESAFDSNTTVHFLGTAEEWNKIGGRLDIEDVVVVFEN